VAQKSTAAKWESRLVGSDLRAWHRLWTDYGQRRSMWRVRRGDCVQVVYKKAVLKGLKMDLSNAESTTDS
jgi:hypothetical protein